MANPMKGQTIWTGDTYPHRDLIRSLGGRWDAARKAWIVPPMTMRERSSLKVPAGIVVKGA